jgi:hypothetical protein
MLIHTSYRAGLFAGLLCSRVESPFIASQTRVVGVLLTWPAPKRVLLRPRSLVARGGAIPVRSSRNEAPSRPTKAIQHWRQISCRSGFACKVVVLFGFDWRWSCCEADSRLGVSVTHLPNAYRNAGPSCVMSSPAASAKGKEKAKPAFKSKWIVVLNQ